MFFDPFCLVDHFESSNSNSYNNDKANKIEALWQVNVLCGMLRRIVATTYDENVADDNNDYDVVGSVVVVVGNVVLTYHLKFMLNICKPLIDIVR